MKDLNEFVTRENYFRSMCKQPVWCLTNNADRQEIAEKIDSALSPENLSCDGEVRMTEVRRKLKSLTKAGNQLLKLDPTVKMWELDVV